MESQYEVAKFGNPTLRQVARHLTPEEITSADTKALIKGMRTLLTEKNYGVGLSAPQVGESITLSVIELKPTPTLPDLERLSLVLINPEIIETVGKKKNMWEGCISAGEGENTLCAKVPRPNKLTLRWLDMNAEQHEQEFEGFIAHTIQHELDHLNGILFVDRVEDTKTYMLVDEFKKLTLNQ